MPRALTIQELVQTDLIWILEVYWIGMTFRFSTQALTLTTDAGDVYSYEPGLEEPEFSEEYDRKGVSPSAISVPFEVIFRHPVDMGNWAAKGRYLDSATADLSYVHVKNGVPLQTYDNRIRIMEGRITQPLVGHPEKPVGWAAFSVREMAYDDKAVIIPEDAKISATTWPAAPEQSEGKTYPLPIGLPGAWVDDDGTELQGFGAPAYSVTEALGFGATKLLVSMGPVAAISIRVFDNDGVNEFFSVTHEPDGLGRIVATADVSAASFIDRNSEKFWIDWRSIGAGATIQGGLRTPYEVGQTMQGAGDVIQYFLGLSSIKSNQVAWAAHRTVLNNTLKIATYINDPSTSPWDWLLTHVFPLLPVSAIRSVDGVTPVYEHGRLRPSDVISITESEEFARVGTFTSEKASSDVANKITLEYARDAASSASGYRKSITFGSDPYNPTQRTVLPHKTAKVSAGRYTVQALSTASDIVSDATSAGMAAYHILERQSGGDDSITIYASPWYGVLRLGSRFRFTDPTLSLTEQVFVVVMREWVGKQWKLIAEIDTKPIMTTRTV